MAERDFRPAIDPDEFGVKGRIKFYVGQSEHLKRSGDDYLLVRMRGHLERARDDCACSDNTCAGCVFLVKLIAEMEKLTAAQWNADPSRCRFELEKAGCAPKTRPAVQQPLLPPPTDADRRGA